VVIASGADLESANPLVTVHPLARQIQRYALFVTLARYDSLLAPEPYYARQWHWSADRRRLTLDLYSGLRWHDGKLTTAQDVAFTLRTALNPATGFFRRGDLRDISSVEVHNDTSLTIAFAGPQPRFPLVLCELPIAPVHLLGNVEPATLRTHAFATHPVGNGPFRFVERRPRQRWVFEADTAFPPALGGTPRTRRLVVAIVDEATTKFAGLVSGELDIAGIAPTMAELTDADPQLTVLTYPVAFSNALVFNIQQPPFDDARVRRAIDASINRQRIIDVALAGYGTVAWSPIPPGHPLARLIKRAPADPGAMLDSAGWKRGSDSWRTRNGRRLAFTLRTVGSGDNALEQLIQADLREQGIAVEIQQMELGAFLADARAEPKRFEALVTGIPGDVSLSHVAAMFETSQAGGALDYSGFHNPALDYLLQRARDATDEEEMRRAWVAIEDALTIEVPVVWLYHSQGVQGVRRSLRGLRMDLRGELVSVTQWHLGTGANGR
jgi:peptide/nickel transport system substrate-binding protein